MSVSAAIEELSDSKGDVFDLYFLFCRSLALCFTSLTLGETYFLTETED